MAALLFVLGILSGSYWALALPVALVTLFALGLVAWVGFTIATIQVEADASPEVLSTDTPTSPSSPSSPSSPVGPTSSGTRPGAAEDAA